MRMPVNEICKKSSVGPSQTSGEYEVCFSSTLDNSPYIKVHGKNKDPKQQYSYDSLVTTLKIVLS